MQTLLLSIVLQLSVPPARAELPMPPPPAGMKELNADERKLLVQAATADADDDPEIRKQVEQESAELEEMRALEDVALDPAAQPSAGVLQSIQRLGYANPLRQRMRCALEESALREDVPPPELPRITDLASFDVTQVQDRYDIPVEMQPLVALYIHFFQGSGRKWFRNWMNRSTRYIPMMQKILAEKGLPQDTVYLAMIESGFSARAYSWARASGPWQFISTTGKEYGLAQDFWVDERRDPVKSTRAAAAYLGRLYGNLGHWYLAWAGYNTGGSRVRRMMDRNGTSDFWRLCDARGLAKETKHYVPKLIAAALVAKHPKAFGFRDDEFDFQPAFEFEEVPLTAATDLEVIARASGRDVEEIKDLNPELKRWCTPPASEKKPYLLRLPKGSAQTFAEAFAKIPASERLSFKVHRVRRGETLSGIARAYKSAPEAIMKMNGLRSARSLKLNLELVVPVPRGGTARAEAALDRQVTRARRAGFVATRPEEEIPAGTTKVSSAKPVSAGTVSTEQVDGKQRVRYGVASGDSLWSISQRFHVTVEDLKRWNRLGGSGKGLQVGAVLTVWPPTPAVVAK